MRRLSLVLLAMVVVATTAFAIDLNGSRPVKYFTADGEAVIDSSLSPSGMASAYMIYGADPDDVFWVRRQYEIPIIYSGESGYVAPTDTIWTWAMADSASYEAGPGIKIPAGLSLLIPAPQLLYRSASGYYRHQVFFGGLADSVYVLPWVR